MGGDVVNFGIAHLYPSGAFLRFHKDQELKEDDRHKMGIKKKVGKYAVTLIIKVRPFI